MPLVVPGINSSMGDKSEWVNKLMGKKISEESNETVCSAHQEIWRFRIRGYILIILWQSFAKKDLPESHRVLKPNDMKTMDHNPNR